MPTNNDPKLNWVRTPLQARSTATLRRILARTEKLLETRDFEDLSIIEIVRKAKTSVGAFYKRFSSKESLLGLLSDRYYAEMEATAEQVLDPNRWTGQPLQVRARALIELGIEVCRQRLGLLRTLLVRNHRLGSSIPKGNRAILKSVHEQMVAVFLPCREIDHPRPEFAIRFALIALIATLNEKLVFADAPVAEIAPLTDEELADELERSFVRYLTGIQPNLNSPHALNPARL